MEEAQKVRSKTILYTVVGIVIAVLVIALLVWNSGIFEKNKVVATVGDQDYTVTELGFYFYPSYNYMANLFGGTVDADTAASKLAAAMGAEKLILLTDVRGLLRNPRDEETLIHVVHTYDVPGLVAQGIISGGMIPKMECCVDAIAGGVERVHILDGRIPHSILIELLSDEGIGTMFL